MKKTRWVIGLTGGLGAGKSTVAAFLKKHGARVLDADAVVRRALAPEGSAVGPVKKLLGPAVLDARGRLSRPLIARRVFASAGLRKKLEKILHPLARKHFEKAVARHRRGVLVLDVPLLFEAGWEDLVEKTVVVAAPWPDRLRRLTRNRGWTEAESRAREKTQMPLETKRTRADFVIRNNGNLKDLESKTTKLMRYFR